MPRQLWMADILADAFRGVKGFQVEAWPGWTALGKEYFEPVGLLDHHTGGGGTYDNMLRYMLDVSSIRPSCNWATSPPVNGVVRITVCCAGRANHAGEGRLPWVPEDQGNLKLIGGEHHNDGYTPWPGQQREGIEIADAAMLRYLGQGEARVAFHKTYAGYRGKWDMHTLDLAEHAAGVREHLNGTTPTPTTQTNTEDEMYVELILAAYRRARGKTYDPRTGDPSGWTHWMEKLAAADVNHGTAKAKLDTVRTCELLLAIEMKNNGLL